MRRLNNKTVAKKMPGVWLIVVRKPMSRGPAWEFRDISNPDIALMTSEHGLSSPTGS